MKSKIRIYTSGRFLFAVFMCAACLALVGVSVFIRPDSTNAVLLLIMFASMAGMASDTVRDKRQEQAFADLLVRYPSLARDVAESEQR